MSISEFIDKDQEKDSVLLKKIHKELKEEVNEIKKEQLALKFKNDVMNTDKIEEKQIRDEKIFDQIESCIINLQDIQLTSFDLQTEEDSDFAQEVVKVFLIGIENILTNLTEPLTKFNSKLLLDKVYSIKKTKNIKDGVL